MAARTDTSQLNWPRWAQALTIAVLALFIVSRLAMVVDTIGARTGIFGDLGHAGGTSVYDTQAATGFLKVVDVTPDGPFAKAGVRDGDRIRWQPTYDWGRRQRVGETLDFTLDREGVRSERQLTIEPLPMTGAAQQINRQRLQNAIALLVSMLIGCFILWRGWGNKTAMLTGAALATIGYGGYLLPPWASASYLAIPMLSLNFVGLASTGFAIPIAMRMFEENAGPLPRWHWRAAWAWLALMAIYFAVLAWNYIALTHHLGWIAVPGRGFLVWLPAVLAAIPYFVAGWRRSDAVARNRFAFMMLAMLATVLGALAIVFSVKQTGTWGTTAWSSLFNALMIGLVAPGLLAYAVLRHKLFDLGFAVNRTLVFATLSAVLLVSFGVIEWAVEHLVPESWHRGSAFYSAGIAVGLFLLFHRIRGGVEHFIERLFFRKWQRNEEVLKRFVRTAAHVEKPEALAAMFAAELARFTGGASAAIYARGPEGDYGSSGGEPIDGDDPALAAMRAEQEAVVPGEVGSTLDAALALPMMHQASLAGFVLLGPKPGGEDYRPDEIEVLGWATRQAGLDLQAIRVRDLEQQVVTLGARNANLSEILAKAAVTKG